MFDVTPEAGKQTDDNVTIDVSTQSVDSTGLKSVILPNQCFHREIADNHYPFAENRVSVEKPVKSISTPGSYKSPINLSIAGKPLYINKVPTNLKYYKPLKGIKHNNYTVGIYDYLPSDSVNFLYKDLPFQDFDTLSLENWLSDFPYKYLSRNMCLPKKFKNTNCIL